MDYIDLAKLYEQLDSTSKRLEKTWYIAQLLKTVEDKDMQPIMLLLQGRVYSAYDEQKIGVAAKLVVKAITTATGLSTTDVEKEWKATGDLGVVAKNLTSKKQQATLFSTTLTIHKVFDNLQSLSTLEGSGAVDRKIKAIAELLTSAQPIEAQYIVRTVLEDLRIGVGEGVIRDAIAWAYLPIVQGVFMYSPSAQKYVPNNKTCIITGEKIDKKAEQITEGYNTLVLNEDQLPKETKEIQLIQAPDPRKVYNYLIETVQHSLDITNDYAKVAIAAKQGIKALKDIKLTVSTPIKVMLYQKASGFEDAFERVGKPAAIEYKYDGFRLNIHKKGDAITLFTRRLEDVTHQFPDVVQQVQKHITAQSCILDGEVIGLNPDTGKWLPFQAISQRIKRKYNIHEMVKKIPVITNLFDIMEVDGQNLLSTPFKKRRETLQNITSESPAIVLAQQIVTDDIEQAQAFYDQALKLGNEGVMMKNLDAPYKPGSRVGYGVKIKPTMETLDLVIIGAEWGEGKRSNWLSSFIVACKDEHSDDLLEVGRVSTGLKEKESEGVSFEEMTTLLKPLITSENGKLVIVQPKIVIEVDYEEIQRSPKYSSGFALRFPRIINLRTDKPVSEIHTLGLLEELFFSQK